VFEFKNGYVKTTFYWSSWVS